MAADLRLDLGQERRPPEPHRRLPRTMALLILGEFHSRGFGARDPQPERRGTKLGHTEFSSRPPSPRFIIMFAILAAASILGARPLAPDNPARHSLVVQQQGEVILRLDVDGLVQARGCNGELRRVGMLSDPRRLHVFNDGSLDGLVWDAGLNERQQEAFRAMMRAFGYSDHQTLAKTCVPEAAVPQTRAAGLSRETGGPSPGPTASGR